MKRILAIALTLVMVLVALTGCMSQQISCGPEEDQNPPSKEQGSQSLNPPVPGEVIDLKINTLDKLNYFAALRTITGTPTVSKQSIWHPAQMDWRSNCITNGISILTPCSMFCRERILCCIRKLSRISTTATPFIMRHRSIMVPAMFINALPLKNFLLSFKLLLKIT